MAGEPEGGDGNASRLLDDALGAVRDHVRLARDLPGLLERLEARRAELDAHERAVLWHLHGIEAWRVARDLPRATHAFQRSIGVFQDLDEPRSEAYAGRVFDTLGQVLQHQGLLEDALREFERALALKEASGDEEGIALTHGSLARLLMELGDFAAAAEHLERDLEFVARTTPDDARIRGQLLTQIGMCRLATGEAPAAERMLAESKALAESGGDAIGLAFATVYLGRHALEHGSLDEAGARAAETKALLAPLDHAPPELSALALHLEAEIEQRRGRLEAALGRFQAASDAFDQARRVSPVEHARFLQTWADAWEEEGRRRQAAELLRRALRRLDATTAETMRASIDGRLKRLDPNAWLLHSTGRFVGHGQIDLLLSEAGQAGFRGQAEDVTVLFSDLRGFTSVSERLEPDVLVSILNRYLGAMTRCVEHFGGYVDKFIGDAVMAVFSLPTPRGDDADRAVAAALYMETELERFNRTLPEGLPPLSAGIGLHRGRVTAGLIGSPQKRSYTVIGDAVNTASRLEGMTKHLGAPLLVTREVVDRMDDRERWLLLPLGAWRPKGKTSSIEVFAVLGVTDKSALTRGARLQIRATEEAFALFAARDFQSAEAAFVELAASYERGVGSPSYARFAAESARLGETPPADDWEPHVVLTEK